MNWICTCVNRIAKFGFTVRCINSTWLYENFSRQNEWGEKQRPGLEEVLQYAREGDTIVVWRLDRLGRNMQDLIQIVNNLILENCYRRMGRAWACYKA